MSDNAQAAVPAAAESSLSFLGGEEAWELPAPPEHAYVDPEWEEFDHEFRHHHTPFESIIRGHLYVQSALIQYVEATLAQPRALDLAKLDFSILVQLAAALGLIAEGDAGGYSRLNGLRNRFAHNVKAEISLQDGIDLYNALGPSFQHETGMHSAKPFRDEHLPTLIYRCIKVLHFRLVKARRFLLELTPASERPIDEPYDENAGAAIDLDPASIQPATDPRLDAAADSSE